MAEMNRCDIEERGLILPALLNLVPGAAVELPTPKDGQLLRLLKSTLPKMQALRLRLLKSGFVESAFALLSLALYL